MTTDTGDRPRVVVIGGGGTGAALAWDLSLRGCSVLLLERGELTGGTTGRHHGQLHCGARYAVGDRAIARECHEESLALRRIVPEAIEYNGGLFVAIGDDDADYAHPFSDACGEAGIPVAEIPVARALRLEKNLNPAIRRAFLVPDGTFDAFRVPLSFLAGAKAEGADIRAFTEVVSICANGGRATGITAVDASGKRLSFCADFVVNASGAWAGKVGALAGVDVSVTPAAGAMLAVKGRLVDMVVSRLRPPGDGDILVPQRLLSIIGSTQRKADSADGLLPTPEETAFLRAAGAELVPAFASAPFHATWCAARPLAGKSDDDGRSVSRDFAVLDHELRDGVGGFCSVLGGKATVLRAMAEKATDLVCTKLGIDAPCVTKERILPSWRDYYRRAD
ncbi:MAG: FAD-dependent oxidoreductase [Spirochaetes bacterium]|nr:FAD-dependent oxidoreductase [Spirochaetota bacterium]